MRPVNRSALARHLTPILAVAALLSCYLFWHEGIRKERTPIDFFVFYEAGERVGRGGGAYDNELDPRRAYVYPQALAHFLSVTHVPLGREEAELLWKTLLLASLAISLGVAGTWAVREYGSPVPPADGARLVLMAVCVGLGFSPVVFGWRLGQADLIIAALLSPLLLVRTPRGAWAAGLLVGAGGVLKLSPLFLLPGLVLCLGWRVAAGACVSMLAYAAWLWSQGLLGHELLLYTDRIPYFKYRGSYPASSLQGMATALFAPERFDSESGYYDGPVTTLVTAVLCAGYAAAGLWAWRGRFGTFAMLAMAMVFSRLVSPFLEPHHHTPSVILLMALGALGLLRRDAELGAWAFAAWYAGVLFVPVAEIAGGRWPALLLIASDCLLLAMAFRFRDLGGEAPLAPGGGWLDRLRVPATGTPPTTSAGGHPGRATPAPPQAASPSGGS